MTQLVFGENGALIAVAAEPQATGDEQDDGPASPTHSAAATPAASRSPLLERLLPALDWARAHGRMTLGLLNVGYQALYLLGMTPFFSPALHIVGARIGRDDGSAAVRPPSLHTHTCTAVLLVPLQSSRHMRCSTSAAWSVCHFVAMVSFLDRVTHWSVHTDAVTTPTLGSTPEQCLESQQCTPPETVTEW